MLTWTEFVVFVSSGLQELIETEYAQIRYGDVGMAVLLAAAIGIAFFLTVARLAICRPKHTRHHSGHAIHGNPNGVRFGAVLGYQSIGMRHAAY